MSQMFDVIQHILHYICIFAHKLYYNLPSIAMEQIRWYMVINEPRHAKTCLMPYANNKGADQPAHPCSLISAFVVRCLDSIISLVSISEILSL